MTTTSTPSTLPADRMAPGYERLGINAVALDRQAKDFVRISNCVCTLDHSTPEAFREGHKNGCLYKPCEAVALRCVGIDPKGRPILGMLYRAVDADQLVAVPHHEFPDVHAIRPKTLFIGRI
jgi:hypothetical protein